MKTDAPDTAPAIKKEQDMTLTAAAVIPLNEPEHLFVAL